ncbi:MAG: glycosyltransferase [Chloroflexota bacterium]
MKASIVLPTYNERDNIVELIEAIHQTLDAEPFDYEMVIVDDNSPDDTGGAVRERYGKDERVALFVRTAEKGLATAIRHGIEKASGDVIVCMDTDFNHDPKMIPQMVEFLKYYDMVIGSRFVMRGGMEDRFRQYASMIYNLGIRIIFQTPVHENLSGFFAMRRKDLLQLDLDAIFYGFGDYFIRLIMLAWQQNYDMLEVPVFYRLRLHGHSKNQFISTFIEYTQALIALRIKLWQGRMK